MNSQKSHICIFLNYDINSVKGENVRWNFIFDPRKLKKLLDLRVSQDFEGLRKLGLSFDRFCFSSSGKHN